MKCCNNNSSTIKRISFILYELNSSYGVMLRRNDEKPYEMKIGQFLKLHNS